MIGPTYWENNVTIAQRNRRGDTDFIHRLHRLTQIKFLTTKVSTDYADYTDYIEPRGTQIDPQITQMTGWGDGCESKLYRFL